MNSEQPQSSQFAPKTQEFQNVAEFLVQQREEERLAEEHQMMGQLQGQDQSSRDQTIDEDEEDGDDAEIQEMKAKFNQILANFDHETSGTLDKNRRLASNGNSQTTGYFKGGVPQEL